MRDYKNKHEQSANEEHASRKKVRSKMVGPFRSKRRDCQQECNYQRAARTRDSKDSSKEYQRKQN